MPAFKDIVGQSHIKQHLQRAIIEDKVSHAYIFAGEAKSGKEFIARVFTQALLCENRGEDAEPCGVCPACVKVLNDAHPDARFVTHEKPSSIRVAEVIEQIVDDAILTPYASDRKVYVVPDAELMTQDAQNKLLKTLEEPPVYATIILLTTRLEALLQTIRSRCVPLSLKPVDKEATLSFLKGTLAQSDYKASLAARFARGNTGRAIQYALDAAFETRTRNALQLLEHLPELSVSEINERLADVFAETEDERGAREEFFSTLRYLVRDAMIYKATGDRENLILEERWEYIRDIAQRATYRDLTEIDRALTTATERVGANVNASLSMELLLLRVRDCLTPQ